MRRHGTTGERPVDRFERDERGALHSLADRPYQRLGAKLPAVKTLAQFDFRLSAEHQTRADRQSARARIPRTARERDPAWAAGGREDSSGYQPGDSRRRVGPSGLYYSTLAGLVESLAQAKTAGQLARRLRVLTHPALMVVDEIGYLPVSREGAVLFFQLINAHHEHASTVLTSNKGFDEWGQVLGDEVMAATLIDRLLHHCHIVNIRGNSYRMRAHQNLRRTTGASPEQEASAQGAS